MSNEVVIVTGANNGIGLGLTRALHDHGYRVAGLDLVTENLDGIPAFICDVTEPKQVETTVGSIIDRWGRIDVLVNNACLAVFAPFEEKSLTDTRREFEVNYFGYVHMIRAVLPTMKSQGNGVIHNVSSTVGTSGFAGLCGYTSAKGAIEGLTRTLALELKAYGIMVNLIHPPLTRTTSSAPLGVPANFMADPEDVGRKLAAKIGSRKPIVTPGLAVSMGVRMTYLFPRMMGNLLSEKAAEARAEAQQERTTRREEFAVMNTFGQESNFSDRAIGCFMGAAIGDAMGGPVECQHYKRIARKFSDFESFLPYRKPPGLIEIGPGYALDDEPGNVTDDTYIRADLTRYLLAENPPYTSAAFAQWLNAHADFRNWWKVAVEPLKRIEAGEIKAEDAGNNHRQGGGGGWWQPIAILYAGNPERAASVTSDLCRIWKAPLERDILASVVAGQAAAFQEDATLDSVVEAILETSGPLATKLFQRAVEIAHRAATAEELYKQLYAHCLVDRCSNEVDGPMPPLVAPKDDAEGFYSGILFAEQQPMALAYFVYGRGDPHRTVLTAVKGGRDADSIATNAASWLGALYGESVWPKSWLEQVQRANLGRLNLREMAEALIQRAREIEPR